MAGNPRKIFSFWLVYEYRANTDPAKPAKPLISNATKQPSSGTILNKALHQDVIQSVCQQFGESIAMTRFSSNLAHANPPQNCFADLAEDWLTLVTPSVAETTFHEYRRALAKYFLPAFGNRAIDSITYEELSLYLARLPVNNGKTFNNIMIPARGVFEYARKTGRITKDITIDIAWRKHQAPGPDPLDIDEVLAVLEHLKAVHPPVWVNYFELAFFSGLRPSEQIALRWHFVDLDRQEACIAMARVRAKDKDTKNHRIRYIDLQTRAVRALKRQHQLSGSLAEHVFINPVTNRRLTDPSAPLRVWHQALKATGIRKRGARQTRHTYATLCLHAGMNPAYVSRQMGHINPKMFFEVYSRWIDGDANLREKAKMDSFLRSQKRQTPNLL